MDFPQQRRNVHLGFIKNVRRSGKGSCRYMKQLRVGIILGGMSSEREVSLNSGRNVYDNMDRELYTGIPIFMDAGGRLWIMGWRLFQPAQ